METTNQFMKRTLTPSRFDWYQVTFTEKVLVDDVVPKLLDHFPFSSVDQNAPRVKQYNRGCDIRRGDRTLVHLCWDSSVQAGLHLIATGQDAQPVYEWLIENYPGQYGVARYDVCMDTVEPGMWEYLYNACKSISDQKKLKRNTMGDWDVPGSPSGRTYYLGSKTSVAQLRLYEKGKKEGMNPDWVRIELQVRPANKDKKYLAATLTPEDAWQATAWSDCLHLTVMFEILVERGGSSVKTLGNVWTASNQDKRIMALCNQYQKTLSSLADTLPGGWHDVGVYLQKFIEQMETEKRAISGFGESPYSKVLGLVVGGN